MIITISFMYTAAMMKPNPNLKQQGDIVLRSDDVLHIPGRSDLTDWWDIPP